ncbi:hypothetical protein GA0070624_5171 [Micromonospora rhizosphaerae]|uniref:Uncharacterized protein n=1 Tax=Micromonospora rhizosphaerae TaxID=568872 RepID=A0A1C6T0F4_9ACTN|nr:hypothetical protein GA0070624_5171 [Micromonospora rhizosphaerae]
MYPESGAGPLAAAPSGNGGVHGQAFGATADCPLSIRPLPREEWAAVRIRSAVVP